LWIIRGFQWIRAITEKELKRRCSANFRRIQFFGKSKEEEKEIENPRILKIRLESHQCISNDGFSICSRLQLLLNKTKQLVR